MAQAFPRSTFVGSDYHPESIAERPRRAAEAPASATGSRSRSRRRRAFTGTGFDLVTTFDACTTWATRWARPGTCARRSPTTAPGWSSSRWPGDRVEDNLNPVGRAYYGFSTLLCTPASLSQDVGLALGTQAGPARIRDVVTTGGFTRFARVARDAVQPGARGRSDA